MRRTGAKEGIRTHRRHSACGAERSCCIGIGHTHRTPTAQPISLAVAALLLAVAACTDADQPPDASASASGHSATETTPETNSADFSSQQTRPASTPPTSHPSDAQPTPDPTLTTASEPTPTTTSGTSSVDPNAPWRSALFPDDWTPAHTHPSGAFLHDFSWAGYHHGEEPPEQLPEPVVDAVVAGADPSGELDATATLQTLLDTLEEGGTLSLPAGRYRIDGVLHVRHHGVVIAGAGMDQTLLHLRWTQPGTHGASLRFAGRNEAGDPVPLIADALSRSHRLHVATPEAFSPGDSVAVGWRITDAFVEAHGMTGTWVTFLNLERPFFRRRVLAIEDDALVLDRPLRYDALLRDHAWVRHDDGYLREVGVQDLSFSTAVGEEDAWAMNRHHGIALRRVRDGWIRRVGTFAARTDLDDHLQSGGLFVEDSDRVLIADSAIGPATNRGPGGNGYLVEVSRANEVLIRDVTAEGGRHNFIQNWDFGTSGVVWLRTESRGGRSLPSFGSSFATTGFSEFHHSLAMANLIDDSLADDGWQAKNRHHYSSGAGHSATESVFWNLRGTGSLWSFQFGMGYVIGTAPGLRVHTALDTIDLTRGPAGTAPEDWREGVGRGPALVPASLYEAQRERRLAADPEAWRTPPSP